MKTIQEAIREINKFVEVYENDYEKWNDTYYKNGVENIGFILKNVNKSEYDSIIDHCVEDTPAGETYINAISYIEDGKPKLWFWTRYNY